MSKKQTLGQILQHGRNIGTVGYDRFQARVRVFIQSAYGKDELTFFDALFVSDDSKNEHLGKILGYLEVLYSDITDEKVESNVELSKAKKYDASKVFIVHGYDTEAKETVARFVEKVGLEPIILHEQPSSGKTIIEKLEFFSNVGYAIVLLTPDDIGGLATKSPSLRMRARQNVILELGYFIGKLSRSRVCAMYKENVEIPSDYEGVVFVAFDEKGAWKTKLAQEFVHTGMIIDLEGLLKS